MGNGVNPVRSNYHPDGTTITATQDGTLTAVAGTGAAAAITSGTINNASIGATTASTGKFTIITSGTGTPVALASSDINATGNVNNYYSIDVRNASNGVLASSDFIATADTGTDTTHYVDMGINGSGYSQATWTINGALDGYLYSIDTGLAVGTAAASKNLVLFAGGTLAANAIETISSTGAGFTGSKGITSTAPLAATMTTNGTMAANITGWSGANWAWNAANSGEALHTAGATTALTGTDVYVSGQSYLVTYTVYLTTGTSVTMSFGGLTDTARTASGTYTYYGTATATTAMSFTPTSDFAGAITRVSVQAMGPALTSCGTAPSLQRGSGNMTGFITTGSGSPTACTATFATAFTNIPVCQITPSSAVASGITARSNAAFTATFASTVTGFHYNCIGLNE
jgi:hypothetical protein